VIERNPAQKSIPFSIFMRTFFFLYILSVLSRGFHLL